MGEQCDRGGVGSYVAFRKVDVVVMGFAECGDGALKVVEAERELFFVLAGFSCLEVEDKLLNLADFEDAFTLVDLEARGHIDLPLCGTLANVSENDGFFIVEFNGYEAEVQDVGEVKDSAAALGADGDDELLAFGDDHEVVSVVALGFGEELDDVGDFHSWRNFRGK